MCHFKRKNSFPMVMLYFIPISSYFLYFVEKISNFVHISHNKPPLLPCMTHYGNPHEWLRIKVEGKGARNMKYTEFVKFILVSPQLSSSTDI